MFSYGCQGTFYWRNNINLGGAYSNEALDERLTLYLGGSKNHIVSVEANRNSWPGSLYRTMFLVNYMTTVQNDARLLMHGERSK